MCTWCRQGHCRWTVLWPPRLPNKRLERHGRVCRHDFPHRYYSLDVGLTQSANIRHSPRLPSAPNTATTQVGLRNNSMINIIIIIIIINTIIAGLVTNKWSNESFNADISLKYINDTLHGFAENKRHPKSWKLYFRFNYHCVNLYHHWETGRFLQLDQQSIDHQIRMLIKISRRRNQFT